MKVKVPYQNKLLEADLTAPIDISIPLRAGENNVNAWYVTAMEIEPVRTNLFVGSVIEGGSVNFRNIAFNPHGNGTHTECVGHIAQEVYDVNKALPNGFAIARLVTTSGTALKATQGEFCRKGDVLIGLEEFESLDWTDIDAVIIRTTPNPISKKEKHYSNTNPPYLDPQLAKFLREQGVKHLLIDLPSVDRELDGGKMLAHKAFWNYPENLEMKSTITELIYVANELEDGVYLLNIQIAPFVNDASPSKPVVYRLQ